MGDHSAVFITLFCKNCNEPRYRSTKPLRVGIDKLDASLFQPASRDVPQPDPTGAAACPFCQGPLSVVKEQPMAGPQPPDQSQQLYDPRAAEAAASEIRRAQQAYGESTEIPGTATELFRLEKGEEMVNVQDLPSKILLVTSRRVVAIAK